MWIYVYIDCDIINEETEQGINKTDRQMETKIAFQTNTNRKAIS